MIALNYLTIMDIFIDFLEWGYPYHPFNRIFDYKPSFSEYLHLWKHPYICSINHHSPCNKHISTIIKRYSPFFLSPILWYPLRSPQTPCQKPASHQSARYRCAVQRFLVVAAGEANRCFAWRLYRFIQTLWIKSSFILSLVSFSQLISLLFSWICFSVEWNVQWRVGCFPIGRPNLGLSDWWSCGVDGPHKASENGWSYGRHPTHEIALTGWW